MRQIKDLLRSTILVLSFAAGAFSQSASAKGDPLPELQSWLAKSLKKHGTYSQGMTEHWISKVSFDGCRMNFESSNVASASYTSGMRHITTSSISFELSDLDPSDISERNAGNRGVRTLHMNTINGDEVVSSNVRTYYWETTSTMKRSVSITVRKKVVAEMKAKLEAVIRACQREPRA